MRSKVPSFIMIPSILSVIFFIFYVFLDVKDIFYIVHPITIFFFIIITILLFILDSIDNIIYQKRLKSITEKERRIIIEENEGNYLYLFYKFLFYDTKKINRNVKKIDHGFDGILELDNKLPMWWIHLFYLTIFFSTIYFVSYFLTDFSNPYKEYESAYKNQMKEIEIFDKKTPQVSLKKASFQKEFINDGKKLFEENCSTCHQSDGSGNVGPNLTDDYWINIIEKDLFKNIFSIIWYGSKNNPTMRAFGESGEIKGNDIQKISSFVYYINTQSKKPIKNKIPQGKKVLDWKKS
ncbi:cbb3-type cytochrome c oxidase N-terminal domain-containing protein [Blattabacterium cuenoti]|uniref:cbb3-type cytochrome c oxidase N-terminal domain-containing protein n=1 Tax=Blattabacterium cuenoti TaxID=1653831 RepID=UPI00163D041B|nr:cbb3-type cytochrome c oxidase N-terminal domain-containing protein [Blattabacterium cuenoti]